MLTAAASTQLTSAFITILSPMIRLSTNYWDGT